MAEHKLTAEQKEAMRQLGEALDKVVLEAELDEDFNLWLGEVNDRTERKLGHGRALFTMSIDELSAEILGLIEDNENE